MSAMAMLEIALPRDVYELMKRRSEQENRSLDDVVREALVESEERREAFRRMGEAIKSMQEESARNGNCNMTPDEINEEIAAARREMQEANALRKSA